MSRDELVDVLRALISLIDEAYGGKALEEMHPDALIPESNGYGMWFKSPALAHFGTAPLHLNEVAERIERRLDEMSNVPG